MTEWIVFDYDGTLATHRSGWTVFYALFGTEHTALDRKRSFYDGEITFADRIEGDVSEFIDRGASRRDIVNGSKAIKLNDGVDETLQELQRRGYEFGILTAGLTHLTRKVDRHDPAFVFGNELRFEDDELVGVDVRVGPEEKPAQLRRAGREHGFDPEDVVYVGDSNSDIEVFDIVGTAVLFDPAPAIRDEVYERSDVVLDTDDFTAVLDLLGSS
jgi:phosphoserine phosphatase